MLLTNDQSRRVTDKILGFVKADDATVEVTSGTYAHLRFAANAVHTSGHADTLNASISVWINKRRGTASTNDLSDDSLRAMVDQAETFARLSPVDVEYLPTLGAQTYRPTSGYSEATAGISVTERARQIGEAIDAAKKAGVISAGFHQTSINGRAFATKNGNFSYDRTSLVSLAMTARTPDGDGSGYFLRNHFDVGRLDSARIAREAIRRARESHGARPLAAGMYPVILEAQAVADLLSGTDSMFDARNADEGRSPFASVAGKTRVGEKIFDERINILSDPWRAEVPGSQSARDGLPAQVVRLVTNGALENLVYTRYWAAQTSKQPTPGPVNTILESSAPPVSAEDMLKTMERGLLVSRFWYIRSLDPRTATVTGLTRDGLWYVENGKVQYPVRNFRFNQSVIQMLAPGNVDLIGAPERTGSSESQGSDSGLFPALRLRAFNFTSQSDAV